MIRILLVDDQAIVREGMRSMLSLEVDITVVGEAASGGEALNLISQLKPDIVLMDVRMPGMDGLTALRHAKNLSPQTSIIMVTLYDDPDYLFQAVAAGAAGYILKDASREELVRAVRITAEGGAIIAPSMMPQLLQRVGQAIQPTASSSCAPLQELSPRELEVLRLIAEGHTNTAIAEQLILSPTTIKTHVQNILQKLGVSDRTQAAVCAVRWGLIQ
ncbi:MAG: response regulator transcription factor [Chloroflexi bacterium]|jgi:DNA-binding NarL/FixJ family response regulator|nr:response regulator transcription factor [Chloroflexota bacterium]